MVIQLHSKMRWAKEHQRLANLEFKKIVKMLEIKHSKKNLPVLPRDIFKWIKIARPIVEGKPRSLLAAPFWRDIYLDNYAIKMVIGGRQIYKSTYVTDKLAYMATVNPRTQVCYVTHEQASLTAFSKQKLRIGTFGQNDLLSMFPRNKLGNIGEISLKNDSTIYCVTDNHEFKHVEGKSLALCMLDESQYLDLEYFAKVVQTVMATKGIIELLGIGGEAGTSYHGIWETTDQRAWIYDNPNWRDELQFGPEGLIIDSYLEKVLSGK